MPTDTQIARKLPGAEAVEEALISACLYGHKDSHFVFDSMREEFFTNTTYRRFLPQEGSSTLQESRSTQFR